MQTQKYLDQRPCEIPADCFNQLTRMRKKAGGYLDFGLPGLDGNLMVLRGHSWELWNRPLNRLLLSWRDFRNGDRQALGESVQCTLTVHDSYSRTIIHRVMTSVLMYCDRSDFIEQSPEARILSFPCKR